MWLLIGLALERLSPGDRVAAGKLMDATSIQWRIACEKSVLQFDDQTA